MKLLTVGSFFTLLFLPILGQTAEYWVNKSGSDDNNCSNAFADACLTIQKGVSRLSAGDTLSIGQGVYSDDGGNSPFVADGTYVGWLDNFPSSSNVVISLSGTESAPIVIRSAPDNTEPVVIDGQGARLGIHLQRSDYIHLKGLVIDNTLVGAIASWQHHESVADPAKMSVGVRIEDSVIKNVSGPAGKNIAAILMWGSYNWVVRNNDISKVINDDGQHHSAVQAYGTVNALIEHNYIHDAPGSAIYWKEHHVSNSSFAPVFESEIRYNRFERVGHAFELSGFGDAQAGTNYFHHNIISGYLRSGIRSATASPGVDPYTMRIEHNIFDGQNPSGETFAIYNDEFENLRLSGNIYLRNRVVLGMQRWTISDANPIITESDYNVYGSFSQLASLDFYGGKDFPTLGEWLNAQSSDALSLGINNPDPNGVSASDDALFVGLDQRNYQYTVGSAAMGIMPDGSNAGPYQHGNEIIGLLNGLVPPVSDNTSDPLPPSQFSGTLVNN